MKILTGQLKNYIMDSVILPLRGEVGVDLPSPIEISGYPAFFAIGTENLRSYRYTYEREYAEQNRRKVVVFHYTRGSFIVADYDGIKVRLYPQPFVALSPEKGRYVMNRLEEAFSTNTPFKEVVSMPGSHNGLVDNVQEVGF